MTANEPVQSIRPPMDAPRESAAVPAFTVRSVQGWGRVPMVRYTGETRSLVVAIDGVVRNSIPNTQKARAELHEWKRRVTQAVGGRRGARPWNPHDMYTVSLALRFHLPNHHNREVDIDNYCKPVLDAVAAGLFDPAPNDVTGWRGYPEHRFRTLLVHRLRDGADPAQEGVVIAVSTRSP